MTSSRSRSDKAASRYLVYVRQSYRRDSDAEVSEEAQEAAARRLLPQGATAEVIRDTGGHQSGATANRDGYRELLRRIEDPDVAGVAVYDLSRLARNARLMLELKAELDRRNLHLIVSNLPDSRFDTAIGRFLFGQLALAAQLQRDLDSERMVSLTRTKHEAGGHNGLDPFGYRTVRDELGRIARPHRLEVVEGEADLVREIFDRYASDEVGSMGELAGRLNAEGKRRRGRLWTDASVKDLIRRAALYRGMVIYRRGADVRPGTHEPDHHAEPGAARRARQAPALPPWPLRSNRPRLPARGASMVRVWPPDAGRDARLTRSGMGLLRLPRLSRPPLRPADDSVRSSRCIRD